MTVNLEGFVLYNTAMNALLLLLSGRLSGLRPHAVRLMGAALLGAAYAVVSALPFGLFLQEWYMKILCAAAMAAIAFLPAGPLRLLRVAGCFFLAALLLGGTGFSLMYMLGARGYGWQLAALAAMGGALAVIAFGAGVRRAVFNGAARTVRIEYMGRQTRVPALVDTGNRLTEAISGLPVMVVEERYISGWPASAGRPVAFHSLGGDGLLPTFEPDRMTVRGKTLCRMRVAVYPGRLSGDSGCGALLPWPYGEIEIQRMGKCDA